MNIFILSLGSGHPDSAAPAIRQALLARGMNELGHNIDFFILSNHKPGKTFKTYFGVNYHFVNVHERVGRFNKLFYYFNAIFKTRKELYRRIKDNKIDLIIIYPNDIFIYLFIHKLAIRHKVKSLHERTELPYTVLPKTLRHKLEYYLYLQFILPKYTAVSVINDKLDLFIKKYNINTKKILSVVDPIFFKEYRKTEFDFPYIAYCGKMTGNKDGVPDLIDAFNLMHKKFPELRLVLIGDNSNQEELAEIHQKIKNFSLNERVIFTGIVERSRMPALLTKAKILAVAKPNNEQNSGNFPIKLGEYLATGVPVVVTKVGEIPQFITDGYNGFLVEPDSPEEFGKALEHVMLNKKESDNVGIKGKQLALEMFNYKKQAKELINFIEQN
ncbi:glycosyltransferase family 4 protein [Saccharicrinis sp. FJH54]|uniref:glycosyltransferase family 4 protein n=1 Tax=Saccharicrinis sp. FJH54 TaxID=3344665 RepID=UPI0035D3D962